MSIWAKQYAITSTRGSGIYVAAKPFSHLIKQLYLKECPTLKNIPTTMAKDEICIITSLNCMIRLHKNKSEDKSLNINKSKKFDKDNEMEIDKEEEQDRTPLVRKRKGKDNASKLKKREMKPIANESTDPISLGIVTSLVTQTTQTTISPLPSKMLKTNHHRLLQ
ncbi:hypothetical protein E6C27_scaffold40G001290 [Cucumis melo var. makuwa]|uniref:Uncharacterized protein n=1 Tax=Cucumis melo var. makuwa TaxID=1194695 RepID=A0A5A7VJW3_CUCMM|nr:hypothetical protein E6C27_scaffold40G001290 [Cucumis melo var. makuwa]